MRQACPFCRQLLDNTTPGTVLVAAIRAHEECFKEHLRRHPVVHNHGIDPSCRETRVNGRLRGECLKPFRLRHQKGASDEKS